MPSIDVTLELVTPAYAGGASPEQCDGLRPPCGRRRPLLVAGDATRVAADELFMAEAGLFDDRRRAAPASDPWGSDGDGMPAAWAVVAGDTAFLSWCFGVAREARGFRTNRPRVATGQTIGFVWPGATRSLATQKRSSSRRCGSSAPLVGGELKPGAGGAAFTWTAHALVALPIPT